MRRHAGYKAPRRCPRILDCGRDRGVRILPGNALTETSSQGPREQREPPAAGKAVSRPEAKTLPSAGRNGPLLWPNAPPAGPRHRVRTRPPPGGGESAVVPRVALLARTPKGS